MEDSEPDFDSNFEIEGMGFGKKDGTFSKAAIINFAILDCYKKGSVELRPGYKTHIIDKMGNAFVKIIPDTRKEYYGAVMGLCELLSHEIKEFQNKKQRYDEFIQKIKEVKDKYAYHEKEFSLKEDKDGNEFIEEKNKEGGRVWIPEKTDLLPYPTIEVRKTEHGNASRLKIERLEGIWNDKINAYWDEVLELCRGLFGLINELVSDDLNNFEYQYSM